MEIADYIIADDRALVELVLQGDNIAFEYLFERYKEAIHRLFIQRTNNPLDADDLLQETFIKVYINIHRYNPAYTFGQWVYTIARNTSSISSGGARRTCPSTTNSRHRPPTTPRPKRTSSANSSARRSNATSRPCRHATDN